MRVTVKYISKVGETAIKETIKLPYFIADFWPHITKSANWLIGTSCWEMVWFNYLPNPVQSDIGMYYIWFKCKWGTKLLLLLFSKFILYICLIRKRCLYVLSSWRSSASPNHFIELHNTDRAMLVVWSFTSEDLRPVDQHTRSLLL